MLYQINKKIKYIFTNAYAKTAYYACAIAGVFCYFLFAKNEYGIADGLHEGLLVFHNDNWAIRLGRWAIVWLEKMSCHIVALVPIVCIYVILIGLSCALLVQLWNIKSKTAIFILSAAMVVAPAIVMQMIFVYMALAYGFACFFAVVAGYILYSTKEYWWTLVSAFLIAISIGMYQSYIGVAAAVIIMTVILDALKGCDKKQVLINTAKGLISLLLGCIFYFIIMKIHLKAYGFELASYGGASEFGIKSILSNLSTTIGNTYKDFFAYFNDGILYRRWFWLVLGLIFVISAVKQLIKLIKEKKIFNIIYSTVLLLCMPMVINVIDIITPAHILSVLMSYQMHMMIPFTFAVFYMAFADELKKNITVITETLAKVTTLALCWSFILSANCTYKTIEIGNNYVETLVEAAITEVVSQDDYNSEIPIVFIGSIDEEPAQLMNPQREYSYTPQAFVFFNARYEAFSSWSTYCAYHYGVNIKSISESEYDRIKADKRFADMKAYPSQSGVKKIDGYYIVKLSDGNYPK